MNIAKTLQFLGVAWSVVAFVLATTFFLGGEWQRWLDVKAAVLSPSPKPPLDIASIENLRERLDLIDDRIDGISLVAIDRGVSPEYGCGGEQFTTANSLVVMHGLQDGTSCGVANVNYLKEFQLQIPK